MTTGAGRATTGQTRRLPKRPTAGGDRLVPERAVGLLAVRLLPDPAAVVRRPAPTPTPASTSAHRSPCDNAAGLLRPEGDAAQPGDLPAGSTMAKIQERGRLVAGVSADTYLLGSRNPLNGKIEGFDIDMVKAVAKAIFGDENTYQLRVITAAQRIPALQDGDVDIVARNMTINCDRWTQIAFSTEYYRSGQKILVRKGSKATSLADLNGQKVCAPKGTSEHGQPDQAARRRRSRSAADNHTGCLVLFQQGEVDAITGDDTVLAGLAAQDPYAVVPEQKAFTAEPYGLGLQRRRRRLRPLRQRPAGPDAQRRRVDRDLQPLAAPSRSARPPARPRPSTAGHP